MQVEVTTPTTCIPLLLEAKSVTLRPRECEAAVGAAMLLASGAMGVLLHSRRQAPHLIVEVAPLLSDRLKEGWKHGDVAVLRVLQHAIHCNLLR